MVDRIGEGRGMGSIVLGKGYIFICVLHWKFMYLCTFVGKSLMNLINWGCEVT